MNPTLRRILRFTWSVVKPILSVVVFFATFIAFVLGMRWAMDSLHVTNEVGFCIAFVLTAFFASVLGLILWDGLQNLFRWVKRQWTYSADDSDSDGDHKNLPYVS